jgi:hypothetical protein
MVPAWLRAEVMRSGGNVTTSTRVIETKMSDSFSRRSRGYQAEDVVFAVCKSDDTMYVTHSRNAEYRDIKLQASLRSVSRFIMCDLEHEVYLVSILFCVILQAAVFRLSSV